jgi:transposase
MSVLSIRPYFPFCRVRFVRQSVSEAGDLAWVEAEPDERFHVVCHVCGRPAGAIHQWDRRLLRDLNLGAARVWINCRYRTVFCPTCGRHRVEDLGFFKPHQRVTLRLARYIYELCRELPIQAVADHLGLDWKTVKQIDHSFLETDFGQTDYTGLRILAVDEIAVRKGHRYLTVVIDYETGRVVWVGRDRKAETLKAFFAGMNAAQKQALQAIAVDMWAPYLQAVREVVPHVKIVFDLFHVVQEFNRVIDLVRLSEFHRAAGADREVFKGSKYLLLANRRTITKAAARAHLKRLLALNQTIATVMILKDLLKKIWRYASRGWAHRRLTEWCRLARSVGHSAVTRFAAMLERHREGILNHCAYPIHTSRLEGINNTIKVIKRRAYGFHDDRYFALKIIQAFSNK